MTFLIPKQERYALSDGFDSIFNRFFGNDMDFSTGSFTPAVDVYEDKENIRLTFEMPGLDKGDIKVWVEDNVLTVSGERKMKREVKEDTFVRSEIREGNFSRSFRLPKYADTGSISADYKNGLLEVTIARAEEAKPKEIEVKIN
ncbi:MAG: Hsp20/alpha crystallin family protein [Candidatus Zixiibacteriota bacterium]